MKSFLNSLLTVLLLFLLSPSKAQSEDDEDKDKDSLVILEEAADADFYAVRARFTSRLSGFNSNFGIEANGMGRFGKTFVDAGFGIALVNYGGYEEVTMDGSPEDGLSNSFAGHAIFGYSIVQGTKEEDVSIEMERTYGAGRDTIKYIDVPLEADHRLNLEAGLQFGTTRYNLKNVELRGTHPGVLEPETIDLPNTGDLESNYVSMLNYAFLRLGAAYMKTYNYKVEHEEYGEREVRGVSRIYTHLAVPMQQEASGLALNDNLASDPDSPNSPIKFDEHTEKKGLGIFLGYDSSVLNPFHYSYGAELGLFPGLQESAIYQNLSLRAKVGIGFSSFLN